MALGPTSNIGFGATNYANSSSYTNRSLRKIEELAAQPTTLEQGLDPTYSFRQQSSRQYNHLRGFAECVIGSTRPFVEMIQHPVKTAAGIGIVGLACVASNLVLPGIGPAVVLGGLSLAGGTLGTIGFFRSANRAQQARQSGDIEGAYKEIRNMGASATGIAASVATAGQMKNLSASPYTFDKVTVDNAKAIQGQVQANYSGTGISDIISGTLKTASQASGPAMYHGIRQATISDGDHKGYNLNQSI